MKQTYKILEFLAIILAVSSNSYALKDTMYVYSNNTIIFKEATIAIDSTIFYQKSENAEVKNYDTIYLYKNNTVLFKSATIDIDSIIFYRPKQPITITAPPVAAFTITNTDIIINENVEFEDQSTNEPSSWIWDFGDGTTSAEQNPSHAYIATGIYTVSLTVTNEDGTDEVIKEAFITVEKAPIITGTVTDIEGNTYKTVNIGTQEWMAENLKTTQYNDDTAIDYPGADTDSWYYNETGAYAWYENNESSYKDTYGALYNWAAVNTGKLCPKGWHVPSDDEWKQLEMYLGMSEADADKTGNRGTIEGGKLKQTGTIKWMTPNKEATDEVGFTALPGGYRLKGGGYNDAGFFGWWWSSTEEDQDDAYSRKLQSIRSDIKRTGSYRENGKSIRCVRD